MAVLSTSNSRNNKEIKGKKMNMNKILGLIATLVISGHVMAHDKDESPAFNLFICEAGDVSVQVEIQHYRQTYGAGPASITSGDSAWLGAWHWKAAEEGTRLSGYHFLTVTASSGSVYLHTLYSPYGKLSGGWLEIAGYSGSVECEVIN
jgi:hypothetical protein